MAYSVSKLNGAEPTVDTLTTAMAQAEFAKSSVDTVLDNLSGLQVYNNYGDDYADDDIMDSYVEPTSPKVSFNSITRSKN